MLKRPRLPTRREPKQSRAHATRGHILTAASRALETEGHAVTMTRIAEVAGYSIGSLYQYYPDRRSLLCDLMVQESERTAAAVMQQMPSFQTLPLEQGVARIVTVLVEMAASHRALTHALLRDVLPTSDPESMEDLVPRFASMLAAQLRLRPRDVRECNLEMAAFFVLNGVESVIHATVLDHPQWLDDPGFCAELIHFVHGYLAAPPAPS
ncbi:MAG: TetR/AcrR family transcriptional regulator [Deltaproteobacteria bacterium]|nr:TetR/AcrR family transcriptional regulator [Deltaproteobacteria bacterium]